MANLNIHLHCQVLDGVYRRTRGEPVFQEAGAPTGEVLQGPLEKIIVRLMKRLTRLGYLVEEEGMSYLADLDPDNPLAPNAGLRAGVVPCPVHKPGEHAQEHAHPPARIA